MTDNDSVLKVLKDILFVSRIIIFLLVLIQFALLILVTVSRAEQQGHWMTLEEKPMLHSLGELTTVAEEPIVPGGVVIGSGWFYADRVRYTEQVELKEIITLLEQARRHVWNIPFNHVYTLGIYDPCADDIICAAQREVDKMVDRKALAERIDQVVKILMEANR